jgi:hypothetical protein
MIGLVLKQDRFPGKEWFTSIGARSFSNPRADASAETEEAMKTPGRSLHRQAEAGTGLGKRPHLQVCAKKPGNLPGFHHH